MQLYITGGRQRRQLVGSQLPEWHLYERALVLQLDTETLKAKTCVDYETPPEARPDEDYSILFKHGTLEGDRLDVCTSTEILTFRVPAFEQTGYVSLKSFNDLHHVCPADDGSLLVVNTGLDMVAQVTRSGGVLREWNVLGGDPWERFSTAVDYRKVATTKPHRSHPNFVFRREGEIWVTRAWQRDAVSLTDPGKRVVIGMEAAVHDGLIWGDSIYFTCVDGYVVVVDRRTLQTRSIINLNEIGDGPGTMLGWCRGLLVLDERLVWVGFTRVRHTKFRENILWVKHKFRDLQKPAHIALYDIVAKKCLQEIDLDQHGLNVVFSIFPASTR